MSKIYEALEKAKEERLPKETLDLVPLVAPDQTGPEELVVFSSPDSHIAECFRFLRAKILHPPTGNPPRTILISSALAGEGKTFIASNLAASISQSLEKHVLLIDADLRNPNIHRVFDVHPCKEGLSTYLGGQATLSELLRKTSYDKLSLLPAGNSTTTPAELLSSEKMKSLIQEVGERYKDRFVIIDSPPIELTPEPAVIANEVDGVVLVVRHGKTPRNAVKAATLKIQKQKLLGIIYNCYDEASRMYARYRYYKYGYGPK